MSQFTSAPMRRPMVSTSVAVHGSRRSPNRANSGGGGLAFFW